MQRTTKTHFAPKLLLQFAALSLLISGCAAPPASTGLEQRIAALLQVQQQQAEQLTQLQQQLAKFSETAPTAPLAANDNVADQEKLPVVEEADRQALQTPTTADEAVISAAAELYLEAFASIATGQMATAEAGFENFIQRYPEHKYTGNANYWLAEALLSQQKTEQAEAVLLKIIENPKQQNKAPAAMARLVNVYRDNGASDKATAMLQALSYNYPESPELKRLMRSTEPR